MSRHHIILKIAWLLAAFGVALACGPPGAHAGEGGEPVQLEVVLNGTPTQLIGAFMLFDGKRIAARQHELEEIGLNPRGHATPDKLVMLDELAGLSYRYEESTQRIYIEAPTELLVTREYDVSNRPQAIAPLAPGWGAVLNYDLFASSGQGDKWLTFNGATATLDGRMFTPYGVFSQSAILQSTPSLEERFQALRLNSTFTYSDYESMTTYRAGDAINGGLAWTRPVRIGGLQAQRNFGLRADLVTLPLPAARGSAAVPSTADIYINNIKTFSQDVGSGPYLLTNLPAVTGSGTARVVLRDASGHQTETILPFYASASLLAPGLFDYSVEAGVPRLSYGTTADTYVTKPVASASARYGLLDWMTLEGHAEGGAGLVNGSVGVVAATGPYGVATLAAGASRYGGSTGYQSYLAYETRLFGISLSASSQMTFGGYDDLASVTARLDLAQPNLNPFDMTSFTDLSNAVAHAITSPLYTSARPPKMFNRLAIGAPLPFGRANLSASFLQSTDALGVRSDIVSATLSTGIGDASVFATAFTTVAGLKNTGFLVGFSMPFRDATVSTSVSGGTGGTNVSVDAVKPLDAKPGSFGWRVRDSEGVGGQRAAAVGYRSSFARTEVGVSQLDNQFQGAAEFEGAIATLGGGVFFTNRIDDAFAVVNTGVPGVDVFYENRPVGVTDASGRALVTGMRSYQPNKLAIDTTKLPVDAEIATSESVVAPADHAGVEVDFAVKTDVREAVVVFQSADGKPLAAGSLGQVEGGESFAVGYDGRAFIKNLAATNSVTVTTADRECHASFGYEPRPNEQVVISPVICR